MNSWLTTNGQIKIIFKQVKYEETFLEIFSNPVEAHSDMRDRVYSFLMWKQPKWQDGR